MRLMIFFYYFVYFLVKFVYCLVYLFVYCLVNSFVYYFLNNFYYCFLYFSIIINDTYYDVDIYFVNFYFYFYFNIENFDYGLMILFSNK